MRHRCVSDGVDGITGGLQFPSSTIQRAWLQSENRVSRAIQPVSNAYEDAAQNYWRPEYPRRQVRTGLTPQGPAARDALHLCPSRSVSARTGSDLPVAMNQSSERPNYAQLFPENPHETVRFGVASDCRKADFKTKPNFCATLATPVLVIQPQRQPVMMKVRLIISEVNFVWL